MKTLYIFIAFFIMSIPAYAEGPPINMLKEITMAGGSLIVDLDKQQYTVSQLVDLASSLKFQSTLTIKSDAKTLSATQCAQIAKARPGQVIFWF